MRGADTMPCEIEASGWPNTDRPLVTSLRGRVVAVTVFQMLCPGCAQLSLPQGTTHEDCCF